MNLELLTLEVAAIARKAAAFILEERQHFSSGKVEVKGRNDFVSYVDKGSERIIVTALNICFPRLGLLQKKAPKWRQMLTTVG
jgi:myo-inositol-1(or 4)-monophosphatase